MPSGTKTRSCANRSNGMPLTRDTMSAEQEEVDVAVDEPLARRRRRHFFARARAMAFVVAASTSRRSRSRSGRRPETCVSRWRIVMSPLPYRPKSGMNVATRSFSRMLPVLDEDHHARRRRHHLRHRRHVEDRVERHRLGRRARATACRRPSGRGPRRRARRAARRRESACRRWPSRWRRPPSRGGPCRPPADGPGRLFAPGVAAGPAGACASRAGGEKQRENQQG